MDLWIGLTIAAAFLQNLRSAGQKHLKSVMGTTGATFVRFGFGLPFALAFLAGLHGIAGFPFPAMSLSFFFWVIVGGATQIGATFLLVHLFSFRNFAVGTAYSRTEPMQAALFALVLFGEVLSIGAVAAIAISVFGVMLISVAHMELTWKNLFSSILGRNALIGLASGTCFGLSAVAYRAASLALEGPNFMMQAAMTLAVTLALQTLVMGLWMLMGQRAEIGRIARAWKPALFTGFVGATASMGWFMAMTLQSAALVKAVAQIEMLFTFTAAIFFFKERINRLETIGCVLIVAGILVLLLAG